MLISSSQNFDFSPAIPLDSAVLSSYITTNAHESASSLTAPACLHHPKTEGVLMAKAAKKTAKKTPKKAK